MANRVLIVLGTSSPKERWGTAVLFGLFVVGAYWVGMRKGGAAPAITISNPEISSGSYSSFSEKSSGSFESKPDKIRVDVGGEVRTPGVYDFTEDDRVEDAISRAGGKTDHADIADINLAAKLIDGSQLRIPAKGAISPLFSQESAYKPTSEVSGSYTKSGTSSRSKGVAPGSISLNTASASELDRLPGVGPSTATKIIEYRQQTGGFSSIDELLQVKGIGPKKLAAIRKYVRL